MPSTAQPSDSPPSDRNRHLEPSGSGKSTALVDAPNSSLLFHGCHIVQNNEQRGTLRMGFRILCDNIDERLLHDYIDGDVKEAAPSSPDGAELVVVNEIMEWAENPAHLAQAAYAYSPTHPGSMSTMAHAITERCHEKGLLLASISLPSSDKRRDTDIRRRVVATIAYQMALALPATRPFIEEAVERDPVLFRKSIQSQVHHLVQEPLHRATAAPTLEGYAQLPSVIVVDGVDPGNRRWHKVFLETIFPPADGSSFALKPVAVLHTVSTCEDHLFCPSPSKDSSILLFVPSQRFSSYSKHCGDSRSTRSMTSTGDICVGAFFFFFGRRAIYDDKRQGPGVDSHSRYTAPARL